MMNNVINDISIFRLSLRYITHLNLELSYNI